MRVQKLRSNYSSSSISASLATTAGKGLGVAVAFFCAEPGIK